MSIAPECTHYDDAADVDCDQAATHELVFPTPGYGAHTEFACAVHLADMMSDVKPADVRELAPRQLAVLSDVGMVIEPLDEPAGIPIELAAADHATRVPEGYECTRIPNHEGPCALRPLAAAPQSFATIPVPETYRPSKWSTPWILLLPLLGYELWAVATSKHGGPLSHLVWWTYGERWSLRWWLCSSALNGLGLWAAAHFMFEWPEVKELLITVACAVGIGAIGWFVTR